MLKKYLPDNKYIMIDVYGSFKSTNTLVWNPSQRLIYAPCGTMAKFGKLSFNTLEIDICEIYKIGSGDYHAATGSG